MNIKNQLLALTCESIDGNANPLEIYIQLKEIEKTLADCIGSIQPQAIEEAYSKYSEKSFDLLGATVEKKTASGKWQYNVSNEYEALKDKIKKLEEVYKLSYQSNLKGSTIVDEATGEIVPPAVYTPGKETISIILKKQ